MHTFKSLYFNLCFFIITILFFLYNYFIFTFNVNPFLGGYFTVVTVSLTPLLIFFSGIRYSGIELFYLFGYFCFAMVGAYHFGAGKDMAGFELEMLLYTVVGVLNNVFVFYLFKNLTYVFSDGSFKYALISLLFMCFVMFFNLNTVNVFDPRSENINVSTYLMFSFMYVLLYFYVLSYFSAYYSWKLFYLTLAIGLFFVFISGSKANFIFLVVSLCIYFIYVKRISFLNIVKVLMQMLIFLLSLIITFSYFPESRIFQIITPTIDPSTIARADGILFAIDVVADNFLSGDYGAYVLRYNEVNAYPHNILSAWVNNGFLAIIFFTCIYFYIFQWVFSARSKMLKTLTLDKTLRFLFFYFFIFLFVSFFTIMLSDQYLTMYFSIMFGLFVAFKSRYRIVLRKDMLLKY